MKSLDIAGYCKKLAKLGFISQERFATTCETQISLNKMKVFWDKHHSKSEEIDDQSLREAFETTDYTPASKFESFLPKPNHCSKHDDFELIHDTFIEPRLTIREGVIRTLQK